MLSPHGHVEQHWQVTELGGTVWIDTEPGDGADVARLPAEDAASSSGSNRPTSRADWAVLSLVGPATPTVLAAAGLPVPDAPGARSPLAAAASSAGWPGRAPPAATWSCPRRPAARRDRHAHRGRRRAGRPLGLRGAARRGPPSAAGFETDHRTIPHEVGWIGPAVHLDKGCYRGQETVARVQNLGKPPRRLVLLHLAGESDELPAPGTPSSRRPHGRFPRHGRAPLRTRPDRARRDQALVAGRHRTGRSRTAGAHPGRDENRISVTETSRKCVVGAPNPFPSRYVSHQRDPVWARRRARHPCKYSIRAALALAVLALGLACGRRPRPVRRRPPRTPHAGLPGRPPVPRCRSAPPTPRSAPRSPSPV